MKLSIAVASTALGLAAALRVKQVSFDDPAGLDGTDGVDARNAKINEGGPGGSPCFVYTSEATNGEPGLTFKEWHIWETCGVFGDGPLTNALLAGDSSGAETDYEFSDTSGDGTMVCWEQDLDGARGVSIQLLSRPTGDVAPITNSSASGRERNSRRCDLSRDGSALAFESDDDALGYFQAFGQEHVFHTDDAGASFRRLVPAEYANGTESSWGVLSGAGDMAAFFSDIPYPGAGGGKETYLWRKEDGAISKVTQFAGKACNRTASFEILVEMYGIDNLTANDLADETRLGSGQAQCEAFAVAGKLPETGAGTLGVGSNPPGISDDGRFITFMAAFESATMRGTLEPVTPVSRPNLFLYDSHLGITFAITKEEQTATRFQDAGPLNIEATCCPYATSSRTRENCSIRNEMRQDCCWQKPCYTSVVTNRLSGDGDSIVYQTDLAPGDMTQVPLDWEVVHYHVPTGQATLVADTSDRAADQYSPSISRGGDIVAFTSEYDFTRDELITDDQIFAAKLEMGCSRDSTAAIYLSTPDIETCCEWDDVPEAGDGPHRQATLSLRGDPDEMKTSVAFFDSASGGDQAWCATYAEQVRKDVACSLAVPQKYIVVANDMDCGAWQKDEIKVTLTLKENPIQQVDHTCARLRMQYEKRDSPLWKSYLTKTMNLDSSPVCDVSPTPSPTLPPTLPPTRPPTRPSTPFPTSSPTPAKSNKAKSKVSKGKKGKSSARSRGNAFE